MKNKKIQSLREKQIRYEKEFAEATNENIKSYYELQIRVVKYDIEDAENSLKKRNIRKNVKRIFKMLNEIEELRENTHENLKDENMDWGIRRELENELKTKYGYNEFSKILYGGN